MDNNKQTIESNTITTETEVSVDSIKTSLKSSQRHQQQNQDAQVTQQSTKQTVKEVGGRGGLDPVRYGDWEKNGRCIDF